MSRGKEAPPWSPRCREEGGSLSSLQPSTCAGLFAGLFAGRQTEGGYMLHASVGRRRRRRRRLDHEEANDELIIFLCSFK